MSRRSSGLTIRLRTKPSGSSVPVSASSPSPHIERESATKVARPLSPDHASISPDQSPLAPPSDEASSPAPETPPLPPIVYTWPESNKQIEYYLKRSRGVQISDLGPFTLDGMRSWTWERLTPATWVTDVGLASLPKNDDKKLSDTR